jgi:protein ImuB
VLRPTLVRDAQPECACRFEPWLSENQAAAPHRQPAHRRRLKTTAPNPYERATASGEPGVWPGCRPLALKPQPLPITVVSVVPEGPPIRFRWQNDEHIVHQSWGPERIETGWWRGGHIRRDYYRVETVTGRRFWIFRHADGAWFLHGSFD